MASSSSSSGSSDTSSPTTDTTTTTSPDTSPPPTQLDKHKQKQRTGKRGPQPPKEGVASRQKPKFLRRGAVVGKLRDQFPIDGSTPVQVTDLVHSKLNIAPSCTTSRVAQVSLTASLTYHLVQLAVGHMMFPNCPPIVDLTERWAVFRKQGMQNRASTPAQEVVLACMVTMGSRRTLHSSIIGYSATEESDNIDVLSRDRALVASKDLGRRREAACKSLVERMISIVENTNILWDISDEAMEAVTVLRATLFACDPHHPFASVVATANHIQFRRWYQMKKETGKLDDMTLSVVEADSYAALQSGLPLAISDTELSQVYGWDWRGIEEASGRGELITASSKGELIKMNHAVGAMATGLIRAVVHLKTSTIPKATGFADILPALRHLWAGLDGLEHTIIKAREAPDLPHAVQFLPHLASMPMVLEAQVLACVAQFCEERAMHDSVATQTLMTAKVRYLMWLKRFIVLVSDPQFGQGCEGPHLRAMLLATISGYPDWIKLCFDAARQEHQGKGPLAFVGMNWLDISVLHEHILESAAVFAQMSVLEQSLSDAFAKENLPPSVVTARAYGVLPKIRDDFLASSLVSEALDELTLECLLSNPKISVVS